MHILIIQREEVTCEWNSIEAKQIIFVLKSTDAKGTIRPNFDLSITLDWIFWNLYNTITIVKSPITIKCGRYV